MKQFLNIFLAMMFTFTNVSFAQTKIRTKQITGDMYGGTAGNVNRIVLPKDTKTNLDALTRVEGNLLFDTVSKKPYFDDGTALKEVGSGAGGGVRNLITINDANLATASPFVSYKDSGTRPTDGTGGSPTIQSGLSVNNTPYPNTLYGVNTFYFGKGSSSNLQGEGIAVPFTVERGDRAKVMDVSFEYISIASVPIVAGGTGVEGDVGVFLYDITNSTLIEPTNYKLFSNSDTFGAKYKAQFQTSATGASYRLIFHWMGTNTGSAGIKFDKVTVTPTVTASGPISGDEYAYTPTFQGYGTPTGIEVFAQRDGPYLNVRGRFLPGTPTGVEARIGLPSGLVSANNFTSIQAAGTWSTALGLAAGPLILIEPNVTYMTVGYLTNAASGLSKQNANNAGAAGVSWSFFARVPIQGWSANTQISDGYGERLISANRIATGATAAGVDLVFATVNSDKALSTTTTRFTAPSAGTYHVDFSAYFTLAASAKINLNLLKNGALVSTKSFSNNSAAAAAAEPLLATLVDMNAGDYLTFQWGNTVNTATHASNGTNFGEFAVYKIMAPTTTAASEMMSMRYTNVSQSLPSGSTTLSYPTKSHATHGGWSGTIYTVSSPGVYAIRAQVAAASPNTGLSGNFLRMLKNGSSISEKTYTSSYTATANYTYDLADEQYLVPGDTLEFIFQNGHGSTTTMLNDPKFNFVTISKIGKSN